MNLSIIIVSYNTKDLLKQCLESVVGCWRLGDSERETEVIVVDNGSTDGSVEMLWKFKIQNSKFKVTLIENEENLGFAKAVNQGFWQARGKAVLLLNSDTTVKTGTLEKLLKFEEEVRPAIIGLRMLNLDGSIQGSVFNFPTIRRAIEEFWLGQKGYFSKYTPVGDKPVEVEAVSGGAMLISKGVIEKIGLFDERYFMYFEDLDYCRRARAASFKVYYFPEMEFIHEHGASGVNLGTTENQWKRLVPSSKVYYGVLKHFLISFILWTGQKLTKNE